MSVENALAIGVSSAARLAPAARSSARAAVTCEVERGGGQVADSARRMNIRLHRHQHALNVGVLDDRRHAVAVRPAALAPLARESERLLVGAFADRHPLRPDGEAGRVHHHEHGGEPAVLFADQPGLRAFAFSDRA